MFNRVAGGRSMTSGRVWDKIWHGNDLRLTLHNYSCYGLCAP